MTRIKPPEETENGVRVLLSKRYGTPCDLYVGQNVGRHGFLDYIYLTTNKQTNKQTNSTVPGIQYYSSTTVQYCSATVYCTVL
jgi:hypothetical protein